MILTEAVETRNENGLWSAFCRDELYEARNEVAFEKDRLNLNLEGLRFGVLLRLTHVEPDDGAQQIHCLLHDGLVGRIHIALYDV